MRVRFNTTEFKTGVAIQCCMNLIQHAIFFDAAATIYFGVYMRDQVAGTAINLKIIRPDNSILYNFNHSLTNNYYASYWYWSYAGVYNMNGAWKWQATYQGQTVTHTFNITGALSIAEADFSNTSVYPNPFTNVVTISSSSFVEKATVTDLLGKTISITKNATESIKEINLETLSNGMYLLTIEGTSNQKRTVKLIKQ